MSLRTVSIRRNPRKNLYRDEGYNFRNSDAEAVRCAKRAARFTSDGSAFPRLHLLTRANFPQFTYQRFTYQMCTKKPRVAPNQKNAENVCARAEKRDRGKNGDVKFAPSLLLTFLPKSIYNSEYCYFFSSHIFHQSEPTLNYISVPTFHSRKPRCSGS